MTDTSARSVYLTLAGVTLIIMVALAGVLLTVNTTILRPAPLVNAAMEVKLELATAHLLFEEMIAGDQHRDIEDVWQHLDRADWYAQAMLVGGTNQEGTFVALDDPSSRELVREAQGKLAQSRKIAVDRWQSRADSEIGSDIHQRHDEVFAEAIRAAGDIETSVRQSIAADTNRFQLIVILEILGALMLFAFMARTVRRHVVQQAEHTAALQREVTERKQVERKLRTLHRAVEQSSSTIVITDVDGNIEYANPQFEETTGYTLQEAHGRNPRMLKSGEQPPEFYEELWKTISSGQQWRGEFANRRKDGTLYWEAACISPVIDRRGVITQYVAVKEDITERRQAEARLQRSESKFRSLYDSTSDAVMLLDETGFFDCNDSTVRIFGCKDKAEFCTKHPAELSPVEQPCGTDSMTLANQQIATAMEKGSHCFEWMHKRADTDEAFPAEVLLNALELDGRPVLQAVVRDITERKRAENALRESEQRFMDVLYAADDAILLIDGEKFVDCNEATARMLGYTNRDDFLMTHPSELSPPEQPDGRSSFEKAGDMIRAAFEKGFHRFEWIHRKANCKDFPVEVSLTPINYQGKTILHCLWRDLTERKQVEQERERLLHAMQERVKEQTCIYEVSKSILERETLEDLFHDVTAQLPSGWSYPEIAKARITFKGREYVVEPFGDTIWRQTSDIIVGGQRCGSVEVHYLEERPQLDEGPFLKEERNLIDGIAQSLSGAVARKRAEEALISNERKLRTITDSALDAVIMMDPAGNIAHWNPAAEAIFGYSGEEVMEQPVHQILPPMRYRKAASDGHAQFTSTGQGAAIGNTLELAALRKDGSEFPIEISVNSIEQGDGWWAVAVVRDITDRKRAEQAAERLSSFGSILDSSDNEIFIFDAGSLRFVHVNHGARANIGYSMDELREMTPLDLKPEYTAGLFNELVAPLRSDATTGIRFTTEHVRKDGSRYPVDVNLQMSILEQQPVFVAVILDISERRKLEEDLRESREKAITADRAKSEFLANMSHEIRTPMTAILGFSEVLMGSVTNQERLDAATTIRQNGEYLIGIINDILDVSKIEAGKLEVEHISCSPCQILSEVTSLMRVRADAKNLSMRIEYDGPIPLNIQSDPTRLRQILINLTGNAIKFTEVGDVRLVARLLDAASNEPKMQFDVVDSGIGMTDQQIARLFKPFHQADTSTTRKFGGTGLGLTISKRLAAKLGGDITVASTPGRGSTFTVTVGTGPLDSVRLLDNPTEAQLETSADRNSTSELAQLDCRVLLAEDGPDNQRLISFLLRKAGADVAVAENGQIAHDMVLAAHDAGTPFDVVLMDMQMPVVDGYEATANLRKAGYTGPIIALTRIIHGVMELGCSWAYFGHGRAYVAQGRHSAPFPPAQ